MIKSLISIVLAALVAAAFAALVAMEVASARVANERYLDEQIENNNVIERLYDELLSDPTFARELDHLLAGSTVKGKEVVATIKKIAPPEYLESTAEALINHLVSHLRGSGDLALTFDITNVVTKVREVALDTATQVTAALPPDPDDPGRAERQLAQAKEMIELSIEELTHNPYVTEVDEGGAPHFILGPGDQITRIVEAKLAPFRALDRAAERGRYVAVGIIALALIALFVIHRGERSQQLGWIGVAFVLAGLVTFASWTIARGIAQADISALVQRKSWPLTLQTIVRDVVASSIRDLTPAIWGVAGAVAGVGVILLLTARAIRKA